MLTRDSSASNASTVSVFPQSCASVVRRRGELPLALCQQYESLTYYIAIAEVWKWRRTVDLREPRAEFPKKHFGRDTEISRMRH